MQIQPRTDRRKTATQTPPTGLSERRVAERRKSATTDVVSLGDPVPGNKVTSLLGGEQIFTAADSLIKGAQSTVQLQMYRLGYDKMVQALAAKAREGKVKVQVLLDPTPGYDAADAKHQAEIQKFLTDAGVEILKYPIKNAIDHVKLLIVDGKSAIIGGMNWDQHSPNNLDADVLVEGPAVQQALNPLMSEDWQFAGGKDGPKSPKASKPVGDDSIRLLTTNANTGHQDIRQGMLDNINKAKKSIHMLAFSLADQDIIDALIKAKKDRNVDVKVILEPGKPVVFPNAKAAKQLALAGIDVRWLNVNMETQERLHAKLCTFDDDKVVVGSSNFTHNGFVSNHEADVEVTSKSVGNAFDAFFNDAYNRSVKRAPDVPDWQEKAPTTAAADQMAQALVGYFKENYTPGNRSRWNDDLKAALIGATKAGASLQNMPDVDRQALNDYIKAGPHDDKEDDATLQQKIKFIGDLAGYLTADTKNLTINPVPNDPSPLWKRRLDIAHQASEELPAQIPHLVDYMVNSVSDPEIKAFVKEALEKVPHDFYLAPSSSTGKFHPADEVDPNTIEPAQLQKRAMAVDKATPPEPPEHPYKGGGLVLHSARVVQQGVKLCDFFGVKGKERDQILAGLALHDIMKFATLDAVKATPPGHDVPWTPYTTKDHGPAGALWVQTFDPAKTDLAKPIAHYIDDHMATWNATPTPAPDLADLIVSLADYTASLNNFYYKV